MDISSMFYFILHDCVGLGDTAKKLWNENGFIVLGRNQWFLSKQNYQLLI
jgi:hypothetical protein